MCRSFYCPRRPAADPRPAVTGPSCSASLWTSNSSCAPSLASGNARRRKWPRARPRGRRDAQAHACAEIHPAAGTTRRPATAPLAAGAATSNLGVRSRPAMPHSPPRASLGLCFVTVVALVACAARPTASPGCETHGRGACTAEALRVLDGRGVPRDAARAVALFERGCTAGDLQACTALGTLLLVGQGTPVDLPRAANLLSRACAGRIAVACGRLAVVLAEG